MSVLATSSMGNGWPSSQMSYPSMSGLNQGCVGMQLDYGRVGAFSTDSRPPLRCYQSQPYTLSSANAPLQYQNVLDQAMSKAITGDETCAISSQQMYEVSNQIDRERTRGSSPPVSSVSQLSPQAEQDSVTDDDDDTSLSADEQDEDVMNGGTSKASADLRADKRKMKRFRLTHNQTRFLMSEFTRQAHPDAAQRERLSRDIPGLSPRQVQVWFQNRRAKLKRLTSDARELVIKSRALPENFDMTQALRSPFAAKLGHPSSRLGPSPVSYAPRFDGGGSIRPLTNESIRRLSGDDSSAPSMNSNSNYGNFYTPSEPYAISEGFSPISPFSERSDYANQFGAHSSNIRSPTSFPHSPNSTNYSTYTPSTGDKHDDPMSRVRATSLATSQRTSMSYSQLSSEYGGDNLANTSAAPAPSTQMQHHNSYSLNSMLASHPTAYSPGTQGPGFESIVSADSQPLAMPLSSRASQGSQHRLILPSTSSTQIYNVQGLQSAPLVSPQDFRIPSSSGFYSTSAAHTGYDLVYGDQGHKFKKEASVENLSTMGAQMQTHYNNQASIKLEQPQRTPDEGFAEAAHSGTGQPPEVYNAGRHRSFTLPVHYSTCR